MATRKCNLPPLPAAPLTRAETKPKIGFAEVQVQVQKEKNEEEEEEAFLDDISYISSNTEDATLIIDMAALLKDQEMMNLDSDSDSDSMVLDPNDHLELPKRSIVTSQEENDDFPASKRQCY